MQRIDSMTTGSLFSGIGGLDLGFERAGFTIKWMCEKDEYARRVLGKHWTEVPLYEDIEQLREPPYVDVITGGFPCQDISLAGKGAGLDGDRSRLWWEMHRIISEVRPRYAVMENVAALINRGLDAVLGSLSEIGYDAEWTIVSAASVGAPHIRERVFIVAYSSGERRRQDARGTRRDEKKNGRRKEEDHEPSSYGEGRGSGKVSEYVAYTAGQGRRSGGRTCQSSGQRSPRRGGIIGQHWAAEPDVGRVAHGVPRRMDRLRGLGNAVVPQVAEYVASCVMRHAEMNENQS